MIDLSTTNTGVEMAHHPKHSPRKLPTALAAALCLLATAHQAVAADAVSAATLSLNNLQYRLIDLDPNDGITPGLVSNSAWSVTSVGTGQPVADLVGPFDGYGGTSFITPTSAPVHEPIIGGLLSPSAPFNITSSDGGTSFIGTSNGISLNAVLNQNTLLTASATNTEAYNDAYAYDYATGQYGQSSGTITTTHTLTTGSQRLSVTSVPGDGSSATDNPLGMPTTQFTLTPNTLLVLQGTASARITADRTAMMATINALPSMDGFYGAGPGHYESASVNSASGAVDLGAQILVADSLDINQTFANASGSGAIFNLGIGYDQYQAYGGSAADATELLQANSVDKDWSIQIANTGNTAKAIYMITTLSVNAQQTLDTTTRISDITFTPNPIDPVIPDPGTVIPEPGTYALMGLGLVGIALVRRRQAA
jgi:hypothetical protein